MQIGASNVTVFDANNFDRSEFSVQFCQKCNILPPFSSGCSKCGVGKLKYEPTDESLLKRRLQCDHCTYSVSLIHGTWFQRSRLTFGQSLKLIYLWCMRISISEAKFHSKVDGRVASDCYKRCREVCSLVVSSMTEPIGGKGKIVELAEARLVLKRDDVCNTKEEIWILIGREKGSKRCFLLQVADINAPTVMPLLQQYVKRGSAILTECWRTQKMLSEEGYYAWGASAGIELVGARQPHVHTSTCLLHGVDKSLPDEDVTFENIQSYLDQFLYLKLYPSNNTGELFEQFIRHIAMFYPGPLKTSEPEDETSFAAANVT